MSEQPKRQLSLFDSTCLIVGIIVGVGIYVFTPTIAKGAFCWWGLIVIWVVGGLLSLCGALGYAELASAYPRQGGDYVYLSRAYGRWAGFLFGWVQLAIVRPGDIAVMAFGFATYARVLVDLFPDYLYRQPFGGTESPPLSLPTYAVAAVVVLTGVNILGVRQGKWMQNLLTIVKALGLLAIVGVAAVAVLGGRSATRSQAGGPPVAANDLFRAEEDGRLTVPAPGVLANDAGPAGKPLSASLAGDPPKGEAFQLEEDGAFSYEPAADTGSSVSFRYTAHDGQSKSNEATVTLLLSPEVAVALILVLFSFGGWNEMAYVAAEVKNPGRNIVRALVLGTTAVTVLYLLVTGAFLSTLGFEGTATSEAVAADTISAVVPTIGGAIVAALICVSALGVVNGLIFTGARISYAVGAEHRVFRPLGQWHPHTGTPVRALLLQGTLAVALILLLGSIIETVLYATPAVYCFYLATSLAVIILRRKEPDAPRPYRVTGYPVTTIIFCVVCGFLTYKAVEFAVVVMGKPWIVAVPFAIMLLGLPLYWLSSRGSGNRIE